MIWAFLTKLEVNSWFWFRIMAYFSSFIIVIFNNYALKLLNLI